MSKSPSKNFSKEPISSSEVRLRSGRVYSNANSNSSKSGADAGVSASNTKRPKRRNKMDSSNDDIAYVSLSGQRDDYSPTPSRSSSKKFYEMRVVSGEKSHLLVDDSTAADESSEEEPHHKDVAPESFWVITIQVFIPFLIAGMGMVGAGIVLDVVQHWKVFLDVPEVFILVPALLGLKGNLEMTLASRLSTQANLGNMDDLHSQWHMTLGNLSLVQCQAIVVGFLASVAAVILGWIPDGHFDVNHALILCTSSVVTASIASFVLGAIMILVIVMSRHFRINPDNVATPIAASLGDLTTLTLLAMISNSVHDAVESKRWLCPTILGGYLLSMPCWVLLAKRNKLTKKVLYTGWTPVLSAMMISSFGGLILDFAVKTFKGVAVFQPVINGVGGNLVAVQASRISTSLHLTTQLGYLPDYLSGICFSPFKVFFTKGGHSMTARSLIMMVVPGHLIFTYTISYIKAGHTSITPIFLFFYLLAALIQVILLLYIAEILVHWLWLNKIDPDNSAIPYLTALGDLLGTGLLAVAFLILYAIGDRDSDVGD
ncbi:Solute carrier family 41 member 1 [Orchesella cincta]|uniref:Solute carrier family 41 member 1 n=1 Tax=Orchesella cincta TaxID=48709 RepID=A0A1D2N2W8_ORCCI|nr:Solute carrier family 41 member 1 [Orchesella cincta]